MKNSYTFLLLAVGIFLWSGGYGQETMTETYNEGDIPTAYSSYDSDCNGPSTSLTFELPDTDEAWKVTGIDIEYDMSSFGSAWKSEQNSYIYFENKDKGEKTAGNDETGSGTYHYDRENVNIANGYYAGETELVFQMRAWRAWGGTDCDTEYAQIDDGTWKLTVHYKEVSCVPPEELEASEITNTGAEVSWVDPVDEASTWNLEYGPEGFAQGSGTEEVVSDTSYALTGLDENTKYDVYVQRDCGDDTSAWVGPYTFKTTIDCADINLEITETTDATITCKGRADLSAEAGGEGSKIYWYDAATGGSIVGTGTDYQTPFIEETTSYWVSEVYLNGNGVTTGLGIKDWSYQYSSSPYQEMGLGFTADKAFTLVSVDVYSASSSESDLEVILRDNNSGEDIESKTVTLPAGTDDNPTLVTLQLDFEIPNAGDYSLLAGSGGPAMKYEYSYPDVGYPFSLGDAGEITTSVSGTYTYLEDYYYFYNWTIDEGGLECESPREEVTATTSEAGDVDIASLPYTTSDDTKNYGDPFTGKSGSGCGSDQNYLNGHDVIYTYTADKDDVLDIKLSDLGEFYAGVFIYQSCSEIGEDCMAGAVAGASKDDIEIEDFHVDEGETYYIVLSSWLTSSYSYTLSIEGFDCDAFEAPEGEGDQNFGTGYTLSDLKVKTTMGDTDLVWYSDAAGTDELSADTVLEDGKTYYVGQQFVDCVSALLPVTVHEIDCTTLEIVNTEGATVACRGSMTLTAEGSGDGNEIYWFDKETEGDIIGIGEEFKTPELTKSKSYWASEVYIDDYKLRKGLGIKEWDYFSTSPYSDQGLAFTATKAFTLVSVDVYSGGYDISVSGGDLEILLVDADTGEELNSKTVTLPPATETDPELVTVMLNFAIPGEGNYKLVAAGGGPYMMYEYDYNNGIDFPFALGNSGEITTSFSGDFDYDYEYYYFYNWTIMEGDKVCESPRTEVEAEVSAEGDVNIDELPYSTTDNTSLYSNDFSGAPGEDCAGAGDYLNGNDVVYLYEPDEDDILDIRFTDITENGTAGLFIYDSCGEIGESCIGGAIGEDKNDLQFGIENFEVTAGETYFFVIATENGDPVGYELDINGFVCDEFEAPEGDTEQYYVAGDEVSDLTISGNPFNEGYKWYSDAEGNDEIPDSTALDEGETYYVSQTVLGCESPLLGITVTEFMCEDLEILSTEDGYVCQSGSTILTAEPAGEGNAVYWYDAETDGNLVGAGEEFITPSVSSTTSFWAAEVYESGAVEESGYGRDIPDEDAYSGYLPNEDGLEFTSGVPFTLKSVDLYSMGPSGEVTIKLIDQENDKTIMSTEVSAPKGTSGSPQIFTAELDFEIPGNGDYMLIATGGSEILLLTDNDFLAGFDYPYELGSGGIYGEITGSNDPYSPEFIYNYFYNWTIEVGEAQCESSDRVEAVAIVNTEDTEAPEGDTEQTLCETGTLADINLEADGDITWYTKEEDGDMLSDSTELEEGETYYASQTVMGCESTDRLGVTISLNPISPLPEGYINQSFVAGETLADLDVEGEDLTWFADAEGTEDLSPSTELVDQTTYYVTQTEEGKCESAPLSVTVHKVLGVEGETMKDMVFYPNPVTSILTVENSEAINRVEVYNLLGQEVFKETPNSLETRLDMSTLESGVYMLRVWVGDSSALFKIIKK